jgi:hypothetical protein
MAIWTWAQFIGVSSSDGVLPFLQPFNSSILEYGISFIMIDAVIA